MEFFFCFLLNKSHALKDLMQKHTHTRYEVVKKNVFKTFII